MHEEPNTTEGPERPPLVWREPGPRGWGRTTGGAMVWSLAAAVAAWWGTTILLAILREELDLDVPRGLRSWLPLVMFVVVLVGLALVLVRRKQRLAGTAQQPPPLSPDGAPVPPGSTGAGPPSKPVPSYGSTVAQVGSSLGVGLLGAVIGAVAAGGVSVLLVFLLMAVVAPEAGWFFLLVPLAAIIGGVVGMAIAMGRRR